ncbi:murein hydrolase activator EnvC family protein [Campylobacter gastrosuis]|uniref:Peptidoglycan DD-metalloendopeptidase family protein n=1 Tax=Campylobacter gastrosuis TaxID=2974576 RepID=A0ABT7HND4_9BACT|nr:M23 family metallopeptidase [Campylobacter gastrosuis]MDL0088432.1 peptidoglycan DD-metalloendopeptidase family protein [Campylobacter gastrosuis]
MRILLIIALVFLSAFSQTQNTKKRIETNKNSLRSTEILSQQLNKKLDDLANDIINGEKELKNIAISILKTKEQILNLEGNATAANKELDNLNEQNKDLIRTQKQTEDNIIRIIAEDFSLDLILEDGGVDESDEAIVATSVLSKLNNVLKDDLKKMAKNYEQTSNLIKEKSNKIEQIEGRIKEHKRKQNELIALENNQKKAIANLKRDKEIYTKKLAKLQIQQDELRKTLEELAIIAKKEDEAQKKAAEQKSKKQQQASKDGDIKQLGSSYQTSSVKRYTGAKTIAPLDDFVVKQKFGNYVDPIYNIKIFNESVVLRSKTLDAKVKSVLNGKVVFAKQTQLLDKVIIIENDNGIHTIYAHLSQIAPTIKVGVRVQKGYIIGRVKDDLTFEVTQKNYHIDPLEMIAQK